MVSCSDFIKHQSLNQSNFYSTNIPGEAKFSGMTAKSSVHQQNRGNSSVTSTGHEIAWKWCGFRLHHQSLSFKTTLCVTQRWFQWGFTVTNFVASWLQIEWSSAGKLSLLPSLPLVRHMAMKRMKMDHFVNRTHQTKITQWDRPSTMYSMWVDWASSSSKIYLKSCVCQPVIPTCR